MNTEQILSRRRRSIRLTVELLIIAGAGSKTRVITFRIAHMLESGISSVADFGVDFEQGGAEMEQRIKELTGKEV
ncbi:UvrD-helicase domain-containing protein [Treponema sp. OMZ 803]|uniref:UvrD-helicase domain-containing protein n=1 Tax=Treponema sp. OMZ 803 TaxID=120682 RepID=UPI0020A5D478|nr:UvrD-helicase domain-containing protein [Treponema sp. OMZ 803]UTC53008.1 UvrD-helicase domain-containing protein [Treponema sp. OMZ 803]